MMKINNGSIFMLSALGSSSSYVTPGGGFGGWGRMYKNDKMTPEQRNELRRQQTEFVSRALEEISIDLLREEIIRINSY